MSPGERQSDVVRAVSVPLQSSSVDGIDVGQVDSCNRRLVLADNDEFGGVRIDIDCFNRDSTVGKRVVLFDAVAKVDPPAVFVGGQGTFVADGNVVDSKRQLMP